MTVNKFDGDRLLEKREKIDTKLYEVQRLWEYLSPFQQKRLYYLYMFQVVKARCRKWIASVPASVRAWWIALGDRADMPTMDRLYSMSTKGEKVDALLLAFRIIERRKRREHVRAVIVSTAYRAGMGAAGACDLLSSSGMNVIYALLFLLVFSVR